MKPRLKRCRNGGLMVLKQGLNPWGEASAITYLVEQYGSIPAFAARWCLPASTVHAALTCPCASGMPGEIAKVRQVLGLPTTQGRSA